MPPRKNARLGKNTYRNEALCMIRGIGGDQIARSLWGKLVGYSKRALVETVFSRLKTLYGERFCSRKFSSQKVEAHLKAWILNKMLQIKPI